MKRLIFTLLVGTLSAGTALAACPKNGSTIFSCTTTNGKQVEICDLGATIRYRFGKNLAKPELALTIPRNQASTSQWEGIGRYMSYTVTIPNGPISYTASWGMDRLSEEHQVESSILVEKGGALLATLPCVEKTVVSTMEGISLPRSQP